MEHFAHGALRPWSTSPMEHVAHGARHAWSTLRSAQDAAGARSGTLCPRHSVESRRSACISRSVLLRRHVALGARCPPLRASRLAYFFPIRRCVIGPPKHGERFGAASWSAPRGCRQPRAPRSAISASAVFRELRAPRAARFADHVRREPRAPRAPCAASHVLRNPREPRTPPAAC